MATAAEHPPIDPLEHQRLAASIAKRYQRPGIDWDDLMGWANLALVKAAKGYDPATGWEWSTYATKAIYTELRRAVQTRERLIAIPEMTKSLRASTSKFGRQCITQRERIRQAKVVRDHHLETGIGGMLADPRHRTPETLEGHGVRLEALPPIERQVLCRRYGLDGYTPARQADVAKDMGMSRSRIQTIEAVALNRLRQQVAGRAAS